MTLTGPTALHATRLHVLPDEQGQSRGWTT
jgi:hypothetical protein